MEEVEIFAYTAEGRNKARRLYDQLKAREGHVVEYKGRTGTLKNVERKVYSDLIWIWFDIT